MKVLKEELKLNKEVYEFIVNNRYLIDSNNFDELFEKAENQIPYYTQDLYKFFYKRYPELLFSITKIPYSMFRYSNIDEIEIPSNIKLIDFKAFEKSTVRHITFNEGLTTINSEAFYSCESLERVKLPNSLETLGRSTFGRCTSLRSISIGDKVKEIKSTTFEASGIEEIELPKEISKIDIKDANILFDLSVTGMQGGSRWIFASWKPFLRRFSAMKAESATAWC